MEKYREECPERREYRKKPKAEVKLEKIIKKQEAYVLNPKVNSITIIGYIKIYQKSFRKRTEPKLFPWSFVSDLSHLAHVRLSSGGSVSMKKTFDP